MSIPGTEESLLCGVENTADNYKKRLRSRVNLLSVWRKRVSLPGAAGTFYTAHAP
jgi:hypothetical protein